MAILVYRAFLVREGALVPDVGLPKRCMFRPGNIAAFLTDANNPAGDGPRWTLILDIGAGATRRSVEVPLNPLLNAEEYGRASIEPVSLTRKRPAKDPGHDWLWLFKDALYVTERLPGASEIEEIVLRIKAHQFQEDEKLRRLREQVANFEAAIQNSSSAARRAIPDDVKLRVWSKDGGACVRCGSSTDLHFDHIIPLVKGGGDHAENIQILCRTCNLSKGGRLS